MATSSELRFHRRSRFARGVGLSLITALAILVNVDASTDERYAADAALVTVWQTNLDLSRLSPQQFADWDTITTR